MKKFILLVISIIMLGGCSLGNKDERRIEKGLYEKYDTEFTVTKVWYGKLGHVNFTASKNDTPEHVIEGIIYPEIGNISDNYTETLVANEMSEYMTEQLQEIMPGAMIWAKPHNSRYMSSRYIIPGVQYDLDTWIELNYQDLIEETRGDVRFEGAIFVPIEYHDIAFEDYSAVIDEMFKGKMGKLPGFWAREVYVYDPEEDLQELEKLYKYGSYDRNKLEGLLFKGRDENTKYKVFTEVDENTRYFQIAYNTLEFSYIYNHPRFEEIKVIEYRYEDTVRFLDE